MDTSSTCAQNSPQRRLTFTLGGCRRKIIATDITFRKKSGTPKQSGKKVEPFGSQKHENVCFVAKQTALVWKRADLPNTTPPKITSGVKTLQATPGCKSSEPVNFDKLVHSAGKQVVNVDKDFDVDKHTRT